MKKLVFLLSVLLVICCKKEETKKEPLYPTTNEVESEPVIVKTPEQLGKEIFEGKGKCVTCHQIDKKLIGPSLQDIAKIYKEKNGSIVTFLKGEADPIVDPSQFEVMKTNFPLTKTMSDEELKGIEAYYLSQSK